MEQKYQVNTFEQGKIFEKLGVKADSIYAWIVSKTKEGLEIPGLWSTHAPFSSIDEIYPAYSCAELGILIPGLGIYSHFKNYLQGWEIFRSDDNFLKPVFPAIKYEAHARAELLIHLLEEKIIKPEDLKL